MKKFRFVGDINRYDSLNWFIKKVEHNNVFEANFKPLLWNFTIGELAEELPNEWEEIIEPEPKPLHKDTDLGYFTIKYLQMQGVSKGNPDIVWAIRQAKELIKQLDNETGN